MTIQQDIHVLREAADWVACRDRLAALAINLRLEDLINMIVDQANAFLFLYAESVPNDDSILASIDALRDITTLAQLAMAGQTVRSLLQGKAKTPGINTFRNVMRDIAQLNMEFVQFLSDDVTFADIISGLIMASSDYQWGSKHRDLWQRAFELKQREDYFIRSIYFVKDSEVINLNHRLWNQVANEIEHALSG
jgi:hypothetical protein